MVLTMKKVSGGVGWCGVGWCGWSESKFSDSSGPNLLEFELGLNFEPSLTNSRASLLPNPDLAQL